MRKSARNTLFALLMFLMGSQAFAQEYSLADQIKSEALKSYIIKDVSIGADILGLTFIGLGAWKLQEDNYGGNTLVYLDRKNFVDGCRFIGIGAGVLAAGAALRAIADYLDLKLIAMRTSDDPNPAPQP